MTVEMTLKDGVATITINRPEALNSIDAQARRMLQDAWRTMAADQEIRVAILTGAGEKAFCTGSDLKSEPAAQESFAATVFGPARGDSLLAGYDFDKPLIAAINGYAIGGGLELALAADIRIAAETASFALTEARIGSLPGSGGTQRLPRLIGPSNALLMMLTGERIDAAEALRIGLVSRVVPGPELLAAAAAVAEKICLSAPLSVRAIKRLVREGLEQPLGVGLAMERMAFGLLRETEDRTEGRAAFREKRKPNFKGR